MTASGTFGYGWSMSTFSIFKVRCHRLQRDHAGSQRRNPQPRIIETASGVLNSIGLQNIGVDALIKEKAPVWAKWTVPVIVNIAGKTIEEYSELAGKLDNIAGISGIEVNISCPNVKAGGAEFGADPLSAAKVTEAVRKATSLPVIVKLTPNTSEIVRIAQAVTEAGADALCLINTLKRNGDRHKERKPLPGNGYGGLSGPAIKPVALFMVYEVSRAVKNSRYRVWWHHYCQRCTGFYHGGCNRRTGWNCQFLKSNAPADILEGIESYLQAEKIEDINALIGAARQ